MTNTKIYDNMTVTVTCNEKHDDIEMYRLIKKLKEAREDSASVGRVTTSKIEAIGRAKWAIIVKQLLELCDAVKEIDSLGSMNQFMRTQFARDDDGQQYLMILERDRVMKEFRLLYGYRGHTYSGCILNPDESWCPKDQLEDKDGWLAKWDEYDIYNGFRSALMKEIQRQIKNEEQKSKELLERYDEFAKVHNK